MKLVFCGTPQFAVPALEALLRTGHDVQLVVTQPDRAGGRGMQILTPPVKQLALGKGLLIVQPEKIKNNLDFRAQLEAIAPEAIIVVAYGRIIPKWMLDLPRHGNLNVHGSLLPKYRGAAPIQWAVARGETVTGVTIMKLDEGLDTGDMLRQRQLPIDSDETAEDLYPKLAQIGAELLVETLAELGEGLVTPVKQDDSQATLAPILTREDGQIDFARAASEIYNRWRGFQPWPGAWTLFAGKKMTISRLRLAAVDRSAEPGEVFTVKGRMFVGCGAGTWIEPVEVQLEGKRRMAAGDFLRGHALRTGDRLGL